MDKTLLLFRVISKCSSQFGSVTTASKVGYVVLAIAAAGFIGYGGYTVGGMLFAIQALTGMVEVITPLFMVLFSLVGLTVFFMSIPVLLRTMFMSTDIEVLAAMPLSAVQIALARVLAGCPMAYAVSAALILPFTVGFSISAYINVMVILASVVAVVVVPLGSISFAALLLTLIMKVFRVIRNRNLMTWVGAIAGVVLVLIICLLNSAKPVSDNPMAALAAMFIGIADFAWSVPYAACCGAAITAGLPFLLLGVGLVALLVALAYVVLSKFYLSAALGMVDSKGKSGTFDSAALEDSLASQSVEKTLLRKEITMYFKNPSYVTSWATALILPLITLGPGIVNRTETGEMTGLCSSISQYLHTDFGVALAGGVALGLALTFIAAAMTTTGISSISREGEGFDFMKTIPVRYTVQLDAKRKVAILAMAIPSTSFVAIGGLLGVIFGMVPLGFFLGALLSNAFALILLANLQMRTAAKKANVHWDNVQTALKTSVLWLVVGLLVFIVGEFLMVLIVVFSQAMDVSFWILVGALALLLVLGVLAFATVRPCLEFAARKVKDLV